MPLISFCYGGTGTKAWKHSPFALFAALLYKSILQMHLESRVCLIWGSFHSRETMTIREEEKWNVLYVEYRGYNTISTLSLLASLPFRTDSVHIYVGMEDSSLESVQMLVQVYVYETLFIPQFSLISGLPVLLQLQLLRHPSLRWFPCMRSCCFSSKRHHREVPSLFLDSLLCPYLFLKSS